MKYGIATGATDVHGMTMNGNRFDSWVLCRNLVEYDIDLSVWNVQRG